MARQPRSLRLELIATLAIVLMMAVVSLSLATERLGRRRYDDQQRARLVEHTHSLASIISPLLDPNAPAGLEGGPVEQVLRASVGRMGIETIEIHRLDLERGRDAVLLSLGLPPPSLPSVRPTADGQLRQVDPQVQQIDHALRQPNTMDPSHTVLVLRLVARPSAWGRWHDWSTTLILAGGVGAILLLLGGLLLEGQVLRPLRAVRHAADQIADGNLDIVVPADGPAEFAALADAFNRMTISLHEQIEHNTAQQRSLRRAEQLASVGHLAAGVAHEIGNPLAALVGYVELLLDARADPPLPSTHRPLLERSLVQLERIQAIVGRLLDFSRPATNEPQPVLVYDAIDRLLSLLRHHPHCRGVELRVEGDRHAQAFIDPGHLDQVLHNLIINGGRASSATGPNDAVVRVTIETQSDGWVAIEVQDTGPGVAPALRPRLFEPFVTTDRATDGTGLGLAISRGLVETMGGRLECLAPGARPPVRAQAPGAVFRVIVPPVP